MAEKKTEVILTAKLVERLINVLSKVSENHNLNVKDKHFIEQSVKLLENKIRVNPNSIKLTEKIVGNLLRILTNLLTDRRVVNTLLDLFFETKK